MKALAVAALLLSGCAHAAVNVVGDVNASALSDLKERIEHAKPGNFPLYFASLGGSVFDGLDFIRTMETAQKRGVRFVCTVDMAASMGAVIFATCDVRLAVPRALILIHPAAVEGGRTLREHRETAETLSVVSDAMMRHIARVLCISFEQLKQRVADRDLWLDSAGALEIGLVQAVLP